MKIGIFVSETWDAGSDLTEIRRRAGLAEELGFASGWVPYLPWAVDSLTALHAAGGVTRRIELGSAVIPTYLFHPLALARQASSVERAIGRPIALGIGCSNEAVIAMHGLAYERPAQHVREYLELLGRAFASDGQVSFAGELFNAQALYSVPGSAERGRLLVGALGPRMLAAAGALSDGTLATWCDPTAIERAIGPAVRAAAREAGRAEPTVGAVVPVLITDDAEAGRAYAREKLSVYDTLPRYRRAVELGEGTHPSDVCLVGDAVAVHVGLRRYADAGLTDLLVAPLAHGEASWEHTARGLAELAGLS